MPRLEYNMKSSVWPGDTSCVLTVAGPPGLFSLHGGDTGGLSDTQLE